MSDSYCFLFGDTLGTWEICSQGPEGAPEKRWVCLKIGEPRKCLVSLTSILKTARFTHADTHGHGHREASNPKGPQSGLSVCAKDSWFPIEVACQNWTPT